MIEMLRNLDRSSKYIVLRYEARWKHPVQAYACCWIRHKKEWCVIHHFFAEWDSFDEAEEWLSYGHSDYVIIRDKQALFKI